MYKLSLLFLALTLSLQPAMAQTIQMPVTPTQWQEAGPGVLGQHDTALVPTFPNAQWWQAFHDPQLDQDIQEALKNSPNIDAALARVSESRAIVGQNAANQLPTLNLNPSYTRVGVPSNIFGGGSSVAFPSTIRAYEVPFQVSYEADLFGKYRTMTQSAKKQLEATTQSTRSAQIALEGDVATAYFNLLRADALVQSQNQLLALLSRIYDLEENQNKMGLLTYEEVIRADRDVAQAQTNLTAFQQQQALAAHQLSILMGRTPQTPQQLTRSTVDAITLPQQTDAGLPSALLTRRPDILSAEAQLEKSKLDVKVARKAFLPTLNLSALLGAAGGTLSSVFNQSSRFDYETAGLSQPLFHGGNLRATLNLRKAQQREQVDNYRQTILNAFKEVEDNLALLRADYENLDSNAKRLQLTQHDLGLRQNLYQQGLTPHLDVLQSQGELAQYQQLSIQSKMDAAVATVNLYKALGGGF